MKSPTETDQSRMGENAASKISSRGIKAAYAQIREFFSLTDLPLMKKLLHQWLLAGIEDQHQWRHDDTVDLIYKMEFLMELTGALWVLYRASINYTGEDIIIRDNGKASEIKFSTNVMRDIRFKCYDEVDFYTLELSREEENNPFLVTREIFDRNPLKEINRMLLHWRDTALTDPWNYAAMDKVEMAALYADMDRLVEAAFIINEVQLLREEQEEDE